MEKKIWEAKLIKHHSINRIAIYFDKRVDLIERIKKIKGVRWSQNLKVWHLPDLPENRKRFGLP